MANNIQSLFEYLKSLEILPLDKLEAANKLSQEQHRTLERVLIDSDIIPAATLGKICADFHDLPYVDLSQIQIKPAVLHLLPQTVAEKKGIVVFKIDDAVHIAFSETCEPQIVEFLKVKTGKDVKRYHAHHLDMENALRLYHKDAAKIFQDVLKDHPEESLETAKDLPIIELVDALIKDAYQNHASDIHIEPGETVTAIRYRIDGILHDITTIPLSLYLQIVTRIKVMANLRTDEQQASQDGKISFKTAKEKLDIRISLVPITNGENVVMRLLSESARQFSLTSLGLADQDLKTVQAAYQKPHGMILVTGPTGSGKTTSMYAVLKLLNRPSVNIMTIEDPVEYNIERVQQIQVNAKTNITFATGLRSIVRQDPDVILVGEIRDEETADIAVNAAMTGHLLLSTLHTNNAATALPRLIDLGVEPYLIASTVNIIVAQRLVRKICTSCRVSYLASDAQREQLHVPKDKKLSLYKGKGCDACHHSGFFGRIGIFEVMELSDELRAAIIDKKDAGSIEKLAVASGMRTMTEDGYEKVKQGLTTIEEVLRVTKE